MLARQEARTEAAARVAAVGVAAASEAPMVAAMTVAEAAAAAAAAAAEAAAVAARPTKPCQAADGAAHTDRKRKVIADPKDVPTATKAKASEDEQRGANITGAVEEAQEAQEVAGARAGAQVASEAAPVAQAAERTPSKCTIDVHSAIVAAQTYSDDPSLNAASEDELRALIEAAQSKLKQKQARKAVEAKAAAEAREAAAQSQEMPVFRCTSSHPIEIEAAPEDVERRREGGPVGGRGARRAEHRVVEVDLHLEVSAPPEVDLHTVARRSSEQIHLRTNSI